jgi:hypothetical protein
MKIIFGVRGIKMEIIKDLSEQDYNASEGLRSSIMSIIDKKTLAHAKHAMDNFDSSDSSALILGSAAHDFIFRTGIFASKWGIFPETYNGTTKEGKETKANLAKSYGVNLLKHADHQLLMSFNKSLKAHPTIAKLLAGITDTELSIFWEEQGIKCKARLDAVAQIGDTTVIIDLKTSRSASQSDFEKSCVNYGYLIQSAHYLAGAKACGIVKENNNNFLHVVVEKEAPFLCAVYCLDDGSLELGEKRRQEAMRKYSCAKATGVWCGYSEVIETIAAPHWHFEASTDFI